jgi:hypothetical protein
LNIENEIFSIFDFDSCNTLTINLKDYYETTKILN